MGSPVVEDDATVVDADDVGAADEILRNPGTVASIRASNRRLVMYFIFESQVVSPGKFTGSSLAPTNIAYANMGRYLYIGAACAIHSKVQSLHR